MKKHSLWFVLAFCFMLSACSNMLQQSGVSTYYSDSNISFHILQQLKHTPDLYQQNHIVTSVYQGNVLIVGQVLQPEQRIQTQQIVQSVPGVQRVYNELQVAGPTSTLTRSSDSWITSKVKTRMISIKNLQSRNIKIVTENGIVYLMGTVSSSQAQMASNVARQVPGVQKVVNFFVIDNSMQAE